MPDYCIDYMLMTLQSDEKGSTVESSQLWEGWAVQSYQWLRIGPLSTPEDGRAMQEKQVRCKKVHCKGRA